jgi:radical SAM protein with 4Fe4S-binding SPASM domain
MNQQALSSKESSHAKPKWLLLDQLSDSSKSYIHDIASQLTSDYNTIYLSLDNGLVFTHPIATLGDFNRKKSLSLKEQILRSPMFRRYALRIISALSNMTRGLVSVSAIRTAAAKQLLGFSHKLPSGSYLLTSPQIYTELQAFLILSDQSISKPSTLGLSMSNRCNLSCEMCPYHGPSQKKLHSDDYFSTKDVIEPENFTKIVDYCSKNSVYLQLGQQDEALMYLLLNKYYKSILALKSALSVTTNGTLLGIGDNSKRILNIPALAHLSVSIDAASDETYRIIRGGNYKQLRSRIIEFFEMAKSKRPDIKRRVCMVLQQSNEHEQEKFFEEWKPYVHQISYYKRTDTDVATGITSVTMNNTTTESEERYCCTAAHAGSYIMPNMDVLPCCLYMYEAPYHGRDTVTRFTDEFWTDSNYLSFRSNLVSKNFQSHCKTCNFWRAQDESSYTLGPYMVKENDYEKHIYLS